MQYGTELWHEGVSGMKWGVRHGPPYPVRRNSSGQPLGVVKNKADTKRIIKLSQAGDSPDNPKGQERKKGFVRISAMSDDELRARISRLELEKKYRDLLNNSGGRKTVAEGGKAVGGFIGKTAGKIFDKALDTALEGGSKMLLNSVNLSYERQKAAISAMNKDKKDGKPKKNGSGNGNDTSDQQTGGEQKGPSTGAKAKRLVEARLRGYWDNDDEYFY